MTGQGQSCGTMRAKGDLCEEEEGADVGEDYVGRLSNTICSSLQRGPRLLNWNDGDENKGGVQKNGVFTPLLLVMKKGGKITHYIDDGH